MIEYTVRVDEDKTKWFLNGKLHREDGPAIERANGDKEWCIAGKRHREDGPAMELADGEKHWFLNGKRHREDGPAIEYPDGEKHWYINGSKLTEEEFNKRTKTKELTMNEIEKLLGYKIKVVGE